MNIRMLGNKPDHSNSIEISCNEVSYRALLRSIRRIPGAVVSNAAHDPMTDDTRARISYKGVVLTLLTPFSDFVIECDSADAFREFVSKLKEQKLRWWERFF